MALIDELIQLNNSDMLPLHMPGHKRSRLIEKMADIYALDITEIDGFDDLHAPSGLLRQMSEQAARIYGAEDAWISVNGSTAANEAAVLSVCHEGEKIVIPRASHKSVYAAAEAGGLKPVYLRSRFLEGTSIVLPPSPQEVNEALEDHPEAGTVLITSPTYEGLIADIRGIAETVHSRGAVLIVDSAHGAHMGICGTGSAEHVIREGPLSQGADICVVSLHKMLPSPTQTALLLTGRGTVMSQRIRPERISHYMDMFESSSPSYVLLAGVGECLDFVERKCCSEGSGTGMFESVIGMLDRMRRDCADLEFTDISPAGMRADPFKVVIRPRKAYTTGQEIYDILRRDYHIQCEMAGIGYALALFGVMDDEGSVDRLSQALRDIDRRYASGDHDSSGNNDFMPDISHIPDRITDPRTAYGMASELIPVSELGSGILEGMISASYLYLYPPGTPLLVPGEIIDRETADIFTKIKEERLKVTGLVNGCISVVKQI